MATHVGKEGLVKIGINTVAELNGWEMNEEVEEVEDTELSDEWRTFKSDTDLVKTWSGSITCMWDETDTMGQGAMTIGASVTLNLYPMGDGAGATFFTGTAIITGKGQSIAKGAITEQSFDFKGTGALTLSTV